MSTVTAREPDKLIAEIIKSELGLNADQVVVMNQKLDIPKTERLFVAVSYIGGKAISNVNWSEPSSDGFIEHQEVLMDHMVQIDLVSFGNEARARKEEVIMALLSTYSQQQQEIKGMQIARIAGPFQNTSGLEDNDRMLTRFTMTVAVKSLYTKTKGIDYYDTFQDAELHFDPKAH